MIQPVEQAVVQRLGGWLSDSAAPAAVHLQQAGDTALMPLVVVEVGLLPGSEGSAAVYGLELRVAAYAESHAGCAAVGAEVRKALEGWMYGAPGVRVGPLVVESAEPGYEVQYREWRLTVMFSGLAILW
jgi:hypothetical protein